MRNTEISIHFDVCRRYIAVINESLGGTEGERGDTPKYLLLSQSRNVTD